MIRLMDIFWWKWWDRQQVIAERDAADAENANLW